MKSRKKTPPPSKTPADDGSCRSDRLTPQELGLLRQDLLEADVEMDEELERLKAAGHPFFKD